MSEKKLNKEQKEAVEHKSGPLLVIAGAGTGKTTVITERIKYIIKKDWTDPSQILALTFTEKAAREMEERVDEALPYGYTQMWISTFHSFCDRVLRAEALHIGLDPRFKLMNEAETVQFIRDHLFDFELDYFRPLGNPTKFLSGLLQHFSRLQDEDINPEEYITWVNKKFKNKKNTLNDEEKIERDKYIELSNAYKKYEELKIKNALMDYGDMIVKTLNIFRQRPNILKNYQKKFKYILVDEFQDTNYSQNELIKILTGEKGNITVVADDDQSIYRFRGAAVSNVVQFRSSFPQTKVIVLSKNYRSNQEILDSSYNLIQHNNPDRLEVVENINKKLVAQVANTKIAKTLKKDITTFFHEDRVENEAEKVAREIISLVSGNDLLDYKDIAILVRANNHAEPFIRAFQRNSVPYQFLGPGRLFRQEEVIDLISYLKVLYDVDDSISYYRVISNEGIGINTLDINRFTNFAKRYNLSLFEASEKLDDENLKLSDDGKEKLKKIYDLVINHLNVSQKDTAGQILYYYLQDLDLLQKTLNPDNADAQKKAQNISRFFDKLKTYEAEHEDSSVRAVVDWIELSSELGESPLATDTDWMNVNAVNILTVHSAKGLEFPVVFLVNLVSQRFPTTERHEQIPLPDEILKEVLPTGDYHMQEERRLFYVGMTRAKDLLYLTAANYYGEGKREKKLSPFIFEALGDDALSSEPTNTSSEQLSILEFQPGEDTSSQQTKVTHDLHIDYLSYSQISAFEVCPLHFKLRYLLKVPTPPSASLSFGTSIHETLKNFYLEVKNGKRPSEKLLFEILKKDWVSEGFTGKSHEKDFFEKGKSYLAGFLNEGFDKDNLPVLLEQKFTLPLPFKKGERSLKIGGVMDRVDLVNGQLRIVDYKTGASLPSQRDVDKNMQLTFYALAATRLRDFPFDKDAKEVSMSLYYLDQQEEIKSKRTSKDLDEGVDKIYEIRKEIESSDFNCSNSYLCLNNCEYNLFCRED